MENKIKLLVFDIDGTLVAYGKNAVEPSAQQAINLAKKNGYHLLIATGRTYYYIHDDVLENVNPEHYVTINGACITDGQGNILTAKRFTKEEVEIMRRYAEDNNLALGFKHNNIVAAFGNAELFIKSYNNRGTKHSVFDNTKSTPLYETELPMGVFIFASRDHKEKLQKLLPHLEIAYGVGDTMELFPQGVDKSEAIESVIKEYGYTWDNVLSCGDAGNDIAMLEKAAIGVAMGNAEDYVKQHADYVTSDIEDNGIYNALKQYNIIEYSKKL